MSKRDCAVSRTLIYRFIPAYQFIYTLKAAKADGGLDQLLTKVAEGAGTEEGGVKGAALNTRRTNLAAALSLNSANTLLRTVCATGSLRTFLIIEVSFSLSNPSFPRSMVKVLYASSNAGDGFAACAAGVAAFRSASDKAFNEKVSPSF